MKKKDDAMNTMTPSTITNGQIERILDKLRSQLQKNRYELPSAAVQAALGDSGLELSMYAEVRKRILKEGDQKICTLRLKSKWREADLRRIIQESNFADLSPHGANLIVADKAPAGDEITFFESKRGEGYEDAYERMNLRPADPRLLAEVNIGHPRFLYGAPNITFWTATDGSTWFTSFEWFANNAGEAISREYKEDKRKVFTLAGVPI